MGRIEHPEPTVFPRGGAYAADLRKWKGGRPTLRDPWAPGWPKRGETTPFEDVARKWAREYRDRILRKKYRAQAGLPDDDRGTLGEKWREYERHRERTAEANTVSADGTAYGHLKAWLGEDAESVPVHTISKDTIQDLANARLDEGYKRSSVKAVVHGLSAFFRWLGGPNPTDGVVVPKPERRDVRPWSDEELERLRTAASQLGREYRRFFELAVCTAGRYSELLALEWEDFDPKRYTVRFVRQAVNEGRVQKTKGLKGDQNRTALVLAEWWPFHDPKGRGRIVQLGRPMGKILEKAGIKEPGMLNHSARHTYARICRERHHIPISVLKVYLGHESERTTEDFYGWMGANVAVDYGRSLVYGKS